MLNDEFPHNVTFQSPSKDPDGGGGYDEAWTDALNFNGFLDTPSSREIFVAQQLQNPLDRNFYYPYRTDVLEKMRCVYKYDDITETYEVIGKPQDQGGQREVMVVPLKLVRKGWPKLLQYSQTYQSEMEDRVKQIVLETATILQNEVKARAPRDGGNLIDSVTLKIENGGLSAVIHIGAFYAVYVNYGTGIYAEGPGGSRAVKIPWTYFSEKLNRWVTTHGMRAQEFWEPACDVAARHWVREMGRL